jgi:hypothetical protein
MVTTMYCKCAKNYLLNSMLFKKLEFQSLIHSDKKFTEILISDLQ